MTDENIAPARKRGPGRPPEDSQRLQFRVPGEMARWLDGRAQLALTGNSTDMQAKADLTLLRDLLTSELRGIRLTLEQALAVADVLGGPPLEPYPGTPFGLAYTTMYEEFQHARGGPVRGYSSYGRKHAPRGEDWEKWEDALLDYLRGLTPTQDYALRWAIAAWWKQDAETDAERFAAVGLRVIGA